MASSYCKLLTSILVEANVTNSYISSGIFHLIVISLYFGTMRNILAVCGIQCSENKRWFHHKTRENLKRRPAKANNPFCYGKHLVVYYICVTSMTIHVIFLWRNCLNTIWRLCGKYSVATAELTFRPCQNAIEMDLCALYWLNCSNWSLF